MPYKSKAQASYFNANKDKIGAAKVDEFNTASKDLNLPEKATPETRQHKASQPLTGLDRLRKKVKAKLSNIE